MKKLKHIACLLDGSVRSAVTAVLLKNKGFHITGITLQNKCINKAINEKQKEHAFEICKKLDIPYREVSLTQSQWNDFQRSITDIYNKNWKPEMDVLFNRHIIFGSLFEHCITHTGAEALSTSHFARTDAGTNIDKFSDLKGVKLLKALDQKYDESYLLSALPQSSLRRSIFPLGELYSEMTDVIAESVGIKKYCIPSEVGTQAHENHNSPFMESVYRDIKVRSGKFKALGQNSTVVGNHEGLHLYNLGQSVNIGDRTFYVADKRLDSADIYLTPEADHPALYYDVMFITLATWTHRTPYHFYHHKQMMDCEYRTSCHVPITKATITVGAMNEWCGNSHIIVSSSSPMRGVTPGNVCALYVGEELIGSATVMRSGPSKYAMNYSEYREQYEEPPRRNTNSFRSFFNRLGLGAV